MASRLTPTIQRTRVELPTDSNYDEWKAHFYDTLKGNYTVPPLQDYHYIDGTIIKTTQIVVHKFRMGDVEDPDLYAAEPLRTWLETEKGEWVIKNALQPPVWHRQTNYEHSAFDYAITATFSSPKLTEYYLRFA